MTPAYDSKVRRRARRFGRQKGCHVFIPASVLSEAGIPDDAPPPFYLLRGYQRSRNGRSVVVSLYLEP